MRLIRNIETHFSTVPEIDTTRSIFDYSHGNTTSFNVGELIPIAWEEVLPGDTWSWKTSTVARLQTLLTPMMGNLYMDVFAHFIPKRLTWIHSKEFYGENSSGPWAQQVTYTEPCIESPTGGWSVGSIADYMGIPPLVEFKTIAHGGDDLLPSALPLRALALVIQEWFRDENLTDPLNIPLTDSNQTGSNGTNYINDVVNGGMPFKVAKLHDMFSSALPDPQKNSNPVTFPLISGNKAPVSAGDNHATNNMALTWRHWDGSNWTTGHHEALLSQGSDPVYAAMYEGAATGTLQNGHGIEPANLWADLSSSVGAVTVNQLRLAFQMQKFYEEMARGGSRYRELVRSLFKTSIPDARVQIPEYLGGKRFPLSIHQVANTAASTNENLGDLGAMSNTSDIDDTFIKSFSEHGYIILTACVRYDHVLSQGLARKWTRHTFWDHYIPTLACIGEQPIFKYELDATVRSGENRKAVFGYNEAWIHYRRANSTITGEMRPGVPNSLATWHLGDYYTAMPTLSDSWIREDKSNVDRVLAVTSAVANQIFADFWFDISVTRVMPTFSVPGLIDHF